MKKTLTALTGLALIALASPAAAQTPPDPLDVMAREYTSVIICGEVFSDRYRADSDAMVEIQTTKVMAYADRTGRSTDDVLGQYVETGEAFASDMIEAFSGDMDGLRSFCDHIATRPTTRLYLRRR